MSKKKDYGIDILEADFSAATKRIKNHIITKSLANGLTDSQADEMAKSTIGIVFDCILLNPNVMRHVAKAARDKSREKPLENGRAKGAEATKKKGAKRRDALSKNVQDYLKGRNEHFIQGPEAAIEFLKERKLTEGYSDKTLERYVKQEFSSYKKSIKKAQA